MLRKKSEILFKWTEPWPYAKFRCKRFISSLFTLKKPQGIFVAFTLLFVLITIAFMVVYRIMNGIDVFVPVPPNLSASMTNAPLIMILFMGIGGFIACLMLIIPLTFICAFLERNITLYADKIEFGKTAKKYNDIRSFEISISDSCSEGTPVLTLYHKEALVFFDSPIDIGISPEINVDQLNQTLLNKIPDMNQDDEAGS